VSSLVDRWDSFRRIWEEEESESPKISTVIDGFQPDSVVYQQAKLARKLAEDILPLIQESERVPVSPVVHVMFSYLRMIDTSDVLEVLPVGQRPIHDLSITHILARFHELIESRMTFASSVLLEGAWLNPYICRLGYAKPPSRRPEQYTGVRQGMWSEYLEAVRQLDVTLFTGLSTPARIARLLKVDWWDEDNSGIYNELYQHVNRVNSTFISNASIERLFSIARRRLGETRTNLSLETLKGELHPETTAEEDVVSSFY
jgi:hypothetical protein